jgi:asparagine synthase (glutamine-hydrolysing)
MCGISGIITSSEDLSRIHAMTDIVSHRGPDASGFYFGDGFSFGHRRLAIVDLSSAGEQPMEYLDRYVIVHNGEIYNYLELKSELSASGYRFKSNTDTEVILAAYDAWGDRCVNRFNGMWAFAIYDQQRNIIVCSRDRFGVKPFYYTSQGALFAFGSEIKQLLDFQPARSVNKKVVVDYIVYSLSEHTNETFFEGIYTLQGGHNLIFDLKGHSFQVFRWYTIENKPSLSNLSDVETLEFYKSKFLSSVYMRLRSDVPVGTCLSGGLDSSSVAAVAAGQYNDLSRGRFKGIHARSSELETDESGFATLVAEHNHINLFVITPTAADFSQAIDDVFYTQEEPFGGPSIFMQYFVMKKASELGCMVILDGQGGDETLLGYERYYPAALLSVPVLQGLIGFFQSYKNSRLKPMELLAYCFYFTLWPLRRWRLKRKLSFLKPECFEQMKWIKKLAKSYLSIQALQKLEIFHTQLPSLLRYEDKNSMRHSVEARLPFLDYRLLEAGLSLDVKHKIRDGWTKYILRKSMEGILPESVIWRKNKLGFNAPDKTWIDSVKNQMYSDIQRSKILSSLCSHEIELRKLDNRTFWKLYSVAKWEIVYGVGPG